MSTKDAVAQLQKALEKDKEYRKTWSANIAMAFVDNYYLYKAESKRKLSHEDIMNIANQ